MPPRPRLSEKNACPIAPITTGPDICEKSGLNRKLKPSDAPGNKSELIQKATISMSNAGIMTLLIFSIPFCTPRRTTA